MNNNNQEKISLPAHITLQQKVVDGILECKKNSKGHFGTFVCVLKKPKHLSLWRHLFEEGYQKIYTNPKKLFLFDCLLLLAALCAGITTLYIVFFGVGVAKYMELSLTLSPDPLINGRETRVTISYNNKGDTAVDDTELAVVMPAGFVVKDTHPAERWNPAKKTFSLGHLAAHKGGSVELEGVLLVDPRFKERFSANLTFHEENKRRIENKLASQDVSLRESAFTATYEIPPVVIKNNWFTVTSTLVNRASLTLPNVTVSPSPSTIASTSPTVDGGRWHVDEWMEGAARQFVMSTQENGTGNDATITLTPQLEINNEIIEQPTEAAVVSVIDPHISIALNETWGKEFEFNTPHPLTIAIKNDGQWPVASWRLKLTPSEGMRVTAGDDIHMENGVLVWSISTDPLEPGETSVVNASIIVPNTQNKPTLTFTPSLEYTLNYNGSLIPGSLNGTARTIDSVAPPEVYAEARYFSTFGDQLGRGPLPPRVGAETKYWIHWIIHGGSRALHDVEVRAALPSYASPTGKGSVSRGKSALFDGTTRSMVWNVAQLDPKEAISVFFEVAVVPEKIHQGKDLLLMNETTLRGTDSTTNATVEAHSAYPLTTVLYNDSTGKSYGSTVEE
jgi:hypothetical protein